MEFVSIAMRTIEIRTTANAAYLVNVGCTNFAYTDKEKLIADLSEYIRDPQAVEEEYNKHHKAYDECAPERPVGTSTSSGSEPSTMDRLFREEPETEGQAEAADPAESIEESGY